MAMGRGICTVCQRFFERENAAQVKCKTCNDSDRAEYAKVRSYLERHDGATVTDVMRDTGVSLRTLDRFIEERQVHVVNNQLKSD